MRHLDNLKVILAQLEPSSDLFYSLNETIETHQELIERLTESQKAIEISTDLMIEMDSISKDDEVFSVLVAELCPNNHTLNLI